MDPNKKSLFFYSPGQDPRITPVSETAHALILNKKGWKQINKHLQRHEEEEKAIEIELERRKYLKEVSYNMTKNWDNSVDKIRQRRLDEYEEKIKQRQEDRMKRFLEITEEQEAERQKYIEDVKRRIFCSEQEQRLLNSALMLSETMYERNLQIEFNAKLREHAAIEEARYVKMKNDTAEEEKAKIETTRVEKQLKYKQELDEQLRTKEEEEKREYEKRVKAEIFDNTLAEKELKDWEQYQAQQIKKQKAENRETLEKFRLAQEREVKEKKIEEEQEDKIIDIYNKAKCNILLKTQEKMQELKKQRLKLTENVGKTIGNAEEDKRSEEQRIMEKSIKEKEQLQLQKEEKEREHKEKLKAERIDDRNQWLKNERDRQLLQNEKDKFSYLTRMKNTECYEEHVKVLNKGIEQSKKEYGQILKEQMKEREEITEEEKKEDLEALNYQKSKNSEIDKKFLEYSKEVRDLATSRDRNPYAIDIVTEAYKIQHNLAQKKKNISQLDSNVPIDSKSNKMTISRRRCYCDKNASSLVLE